MKSEIEWFDVKETPPPDGLRLLFVNKHGHMTFGVYEDDPKMYSDDYCQLIYHPVMWAYPPDVPMFLKGIITNDKWVSNLSKKEGWSEDNLRR